MKRQIIYYELDKEISIKTQDKIIRLLQSEGAKNIEIGFLGGKE